MFRGKIFFEFHGRLISIFYKAKNICKYPLDEVIW